MRDDRGMVTENTAPIIYHVTCHSHQGTHCAGRMTFHELSAHIDACPHRHCAEPWGHCMHMHY